LFSTIRVFFVSAFACSLLIGGCSSTDIGVPSDSTTGMDTTADAPSDLSTQVDATVDVPSDLSTQVDTTVDVPSDVSVSPDVQVDMSSGMDVALDATPAILAIEACLLVEEDAGITCVPELTLDWGAIDPGASANGALQLINVGSLDGEITNVFWSKDGTPVEDELLSYALDGAADDADGLPPLIEQGNSRNIQLNLAPGLEPGPLPADTVSIVVSAANGEAQVVEVILVGAIAECAVGVASCDDDWVNGCEADTLTTIAHCGGCDQFCSAVNGGAACEGGLCVLACDDGWEGSLCDTNIDECLNSPCDANAACTDNEGSFSCACNTGYAGDGLSCSNVDECLSNPCGANAACTDNAGSFTCACNTGYAGNGLSCSNVDECLNSPCDANAACTDNEGSFSCACNTGYAGDGLSCSNVDECLSNPCGANAACTDNAGSFTCACNTGYAGNGLSCSNVDECLSNPCDANAACTDNEGSFTCACNTGYAGDGLSCDNVNECITSPCGVGTCSDTLGSYSCNCPSGYSFTNGTCVLTNVCLAFAPCGVGTCVDTAGSYTCNCPQGYHFVNGTCQVPTLVSTKTLSYVGNAGAVWNHTVSLYSDGQVIAQTNYSLPTIIPSTGTVSASQIFSGSCVSASFSGTFVSSGAPFTTVVSYCRTGNAVTISHTAGAPVQVHGTVVL
jgi:hypothetical protein